LLRNNKARSSKECRKWRTFSGLLPNQYQRASTGIMCIARVSHTSLL